MSITRRNLIAGASATALVAPFGSAFAQKAEFTVKYGNNLPVTHPMNIRAAEMAAKIKEESKGRLDFQVYPNNQLGNDTDMLSQVRAGRPSSLNRCSPKARGVTASPGPPMGSTRLCRLASCRQLAR